MSKRNIVSVCAGVVALSTLLVGLAAPAGAAHHEGLSDQEKALVKEALSAAPPAIGKDATVMNWDGKKLKEGTNGWTCMPTPPHIVGGAAPMCNDAVWMEWADAYLNKKDYAGGKLGISYMLAGDEGASNIDPYAEGPTEDNQWIKEGPHLMILAPKAMLEGMSTDPWNGGPYVMWKDTPYEHIMVPLGER